MTAIGIIIILICVLILALDKPIEKMAEAAGKKLDIFPDNRKWILYIVMVASLVLVFNPFSNNDAGERQVVQTIGGDLYVRFDPGFYMSGFFSKVTTYPNNVTLQISPKEERSPDSDYWMPPHDGTFAEGDAASLSHTVKWDLPSQEAVMLKLHTTYGNIANLATTTLMQFQKQTASYSCQRLTSEDHYSGGQSQLNEYFQDQLTYGQVLLKTDTKTKTQTDGTSKTYIQVEPRRDDNGQILRNSKSIADINAVGMSPSFASVDHVEYTPEIYEKLKTKIEFAADEANSKQQLVAAQQKAATAKVIGEEQIAIVKADEEAAEQREVIQARKAKLVAQEQALQAKFTADKIEEEGRAQAAANRALVLAGLTPVQQMERDIRIADVVSKNIAGATSPQVVILGGGEGGSGANEALKVFGAERALELIKKLDKGN